MIKLLSYFVTITITYYEYISLSGLVSVLSDNKIKFII